MEYVIDLLTADNNHIETVCKPFECLPLAMDWAKARIGETHKNGSIIGKVKISNENDCNCIVIER